MRVLTIAGWLVTAAMLAILAVAWLETLSMYGVLRSKLLRTTLRYGLAGPPRTWAGVSAVLLLAAVASVGIWGLDQPPFWLFVVASATAFSRMALPPAALLLGTSAADRDVLDIVIARLCPMRVVHLLDLATTTSMRPRAKVSWRDIVDWLMETVPLIVVDTRFDTSAVVSELERLLHPNIAEKSIYITHDDGRAPALDRVTAGAHPGGLQLVRTNEIGGAVREFRRHPRKRHDSVREF